LCCAHARFLEPDIWLAWRPTLRKAGFAASAGPPDYAVTPDGQKFLIDVLAQQAGQVNAVIVVQNWTAGLKK